MSRQSKSLIVVVVAVLGLWGCAQGTSKPAAKLEERIKALEAKCAQLEKDHKSVTAARDQARLRLAEVERERDQLRKEAEEFKAVLKERDDLKSLVASRTAERDALHMQFDVLRKGIRSLLGRAESALPASLELNGTPTTSTAPAPRSKL